MLQKALVTGLKNTRRRKNIVFAHSVFALLFSGVVRANLGCNQVGTEANLDSVSLLENVQNVALEKRYCTTTALRMIYSLQFMHLRMLQRI